MFDADTSVIVRKYAGILREILIFAIIKVDYTREARNTFMPTFAEKLHEVRKARDFTQDQLAKFPQL